MTSAIFYQDFENDFRHIAMKNLRSDVSYEESSKQLRKIIKSEVLKFTDLRNNPSKFFKSHKLLAELSPSLGPGFWIRFTVQYNLFAGTILAVGNSEQVKLLDGMQKKGQLGCFALTEKLGIYIYYYILLYIYIYYYLINIYVIYIYIYIYI